MTSRVAKLPKIRIERKVQLRKSLKLWHIVVIGLAYLTPMTVFDTFVLVSEKSDGHVPMAYILALGAILFTAISYGRLVRQFPEAGSAYTYAQKAINPFVGFIVGWLSLLDYMFLPMINVLLARIYLSAMFPDIPSWLFVVGVIVVMTLSNLRSVNWVANLNTVLVFFQLAILVGFVYVVWRLVVSESGSAGLISMTPFFSEDAKLIPIISGATMLCFSFLGFDAVSTLSEETENARVTIPRAIFLTAFLGGVIFIGVSYFIQLYFPDLSVINNPDNALPDIAYHVGGLGFQVLLSVCAAVGAFASGLASHASIARLLYVMGRDRVFPERIFGYLHPEWQTPAFNIVIVGIVALLAAFIDLERALSLINFGALVAFTFVNLSVIVFFYVKQKKNKSAKEHIKYLIMPLIGAAMIGILWLNLPTGSLELGLVWGAIGITYLGYLTKWFKRPPPTVHAPRE